MAFRPCFGTLINSLKHGTVFTTTHKTCTYSSACCTIQTSLFKIKIKKICHINVNRDNNAIRERHEIHFNPKIHFEYQKKIEDLLECSASDARSFLLKNFGQDNMDCLSRIAKIFRQHSLPLKIILDDRPMKHWQKFEMRCYSLQEMGFRKISVLLINVYEELMKMTASEIRSSYGGSLDVHPLDALMKIDAMPPDFMEKHADLRSASLGTIRHAVLVEMLGWKLKLEDQKDLNTVFDIYKFLENRPLHQIAQACDLLKDKLQFTSQKIFTNGFLLANHPDHIERFLDEFPTLGGNDTRELIRKFPRVLTIRMERVFEIESSLLSEGFTPYQIMQCGNILSLHPETIKERLETMRSTPELVALKEHPRYLFVLYFLPKVFGRLRRLEQTGDPITVNMLTCSEARFLCYTLTGDERDRFLEFIKYVASELRAKRSTVHRKLEPLLNRVLSSDRDAVREALASMKRIYPNGVILDNIQLIFCSSEQLDEALEQLKTFTKSKCLKSRSVGSSFFTTFKYGRTSVEKKQSHSNKNELNNE